MTVQVTCDWCALPIDDDETYTGEELNRLGFEEGLDEGRHVIVESRFSGRDRWGYVRTRSEVRHFHSAHCYLAALSLWDDQCRWARAQGGGPIAAPPRWQGEALVDDPPRQASDMRKKHTNKGDRIRAEIAAEKKERDRRAAEGTSVMYGSGLDDEERFALWRADVVTFEELATLTEAELLAVNRIGPKRAARIVRAMRMRGFSLRPSAEED